MSHSSLIAILLLSPLIGFLINGLNFRSKNVKLFGSIASAAAGLSFICSVLLYKYLLGMTESARNICASFFNWMTVGGFNIDAGFAVDQISAIMILIITGVGSLIHIFSIGYMSHDERPAKYFSYLNLFLFNMLLLVLGDNLLIMFIGWEGVGLCSYLLIGFWFKDVEKAAAGMKAFIVNRIGDAGLLLGGFILIQQFGSLEFSSINEIASTINPEVSMGPLTVACLLLFLGATGKSAQIPLYVWLPDAMAGPTPVSALIHAATMVTAGVYMIVRLSYLFIAASIAMEVVAIVGAVTAVGAATIGLTQWDIKKVLAYSTVSQLGYMFLACGVGAFGAAMFHLMTHAFFKALMFLGSGSVIHAMHEEQDIRKMGGLKKYLPITHLTFLMGWLAIIGTPLFSGFFSKDEILWFSFHSPRGHFFLWLAGAVGAGLTAFYMTRLMALTFWGKSRVSKDIHPHESPPSMTIPLIVLAVLSAIGGWIGVPHVIGGSTIPNFFEHWLHPVVSAIPGLKPANHSLEWLFMGISVAIAGLSALLAYLFYVSEPGRSESIVKKFPRLYQLIYNKYWIDEIYFSKIVNPTINLAMGLWEYIDVKFIDRITYKLSAFVKNSAEGMRSFQTGNMQKYALYIIVGLVCAISFVLG